MTSPNSFNTLLQLINNQRWQEAAKSAESLLIQNPGDQKLIKILLYAYSQLRQFDQVIKHASHYIHHFPQDAAGHSMLANAYRYSRLNQKAQTTLIKAIEQGCDNAAIYNQLGLLQQEANSTAEAIASFQAAIARNPKLTSAYRNRATVQPNWSVSDIAFAENLLRDPQLSRAELAELYYALFNVYQAKNDYERAFDYLRQGAELKRSSLQYDHHKEMMEMAKLASTFSQNMFNKRGEYASSASTPIFICGLPRSGTTLVEQILSCHPHVTAGDEIDDLPKATEHVLRKHNIQQAYPDWISTLTPEHLAEIRHSYLTSTKYLQGKRYFTDKMLLNYKAIGLIQLVFPDAKIIHCQRNPMDNLFGCYKQIFGEGLRFSYDFNELADTYNAYRKLMQHWHAVLPNRVFDVTYEDLAQHPKTIIDEMLNHLGLPHHQACYAFHTSKRIALTISTSQIKQPMTTSYINGWKRYQQQLLPLAELIDENL